MSGCLRETQVQTYINLVEEGYNLVYLVSDSVSTSKIKPFMQKYPERLVNVGIAEQNLMGMAAGKKVSGQAGMPVADDGRGVSVDKQQPAFADLRRGRA